MEWVLVCDVPGCELEGVAQSVVGEFVACASCGAIKSRDGAK